MILSIHAIALDHARSQIIQQCDLSFTAVTQIIALYEQGGANALKPKRRGRRAGEARRLSAKQELLIQKLICDKRPEQLKMSLARWNRAAVSQLIEQECDIKLPVRSVGNDLERRGFTPQKPIQRAYEQSPAAVQKWLDESQPDIARQAREEGGEIYWGDETALVNTDVRQHYFAPKGQTPVVYAPGTRQRLSMAAAITNKGTARWQVIDGNFERQVARGGQ